MSGKPNKSSLVRALARKSLLTFIKLFKPDFQTPRHIRDLAGKLERLAYCALNRDDPGVAAELLTHLQVFMPPQNGKSTITSEYFIAWLLGHNPKLRLAFATYNAEFAEKRGRSIMAIMQHPLYLAVFPGTELSKTSAAHFETTEGGFVRCTGIEGGLNGYAIDGIVIDDPYNGTKDADSKAYREGVWAWYQETVSVRVKPGDFCIIVNTRWHVDDLSGLTLRNEAHKNWVVCKYQAINEDGEALWPERFPLQWLTDMRSTMTPRKWAALYQQEPTPAEGAIFVMSGLKEYSKDTLPSRFDLIVQSVDSAQKVSQASDPTVIETFGVLGDKAYTLNVLRKRMGYPELKRTVISHALEWSAELVLIEDKSSGISLLQDLKDSGELSCPVIGIIPEGSKSDRALGVSDLVEAGHVLLPDAAPWLADFTYELACFPIVTHDDQVDALSQFLAWFKKRMHRVSVAGRAGRPRVISSTFTSNLELVPMQ